MTKLTIIGAGSAVFTKNIFTDLMFIDDFKKMDIALVDIDEKRLKISHELLDVIAKKLNASPNIKSYTNRKEALSGSDFVQSTIQVGGYKPSTVIDFDIPNQFGLKQTIADTLGIGGIMRGLRTIPVLVDIGKDIMDLCPNSLWLQYVNPMCSNMIAINSACPGIKSIGLCHSVQGTAEMLARDLNEKIEDIDYLCAGINHMAFYKKFTKKNGNGGEDLYPKLKKLADDIVNDKITSTRSIGKDSESDKVLHEKVRYEILKRFGYFVTESSEHFAEYVPWFIKQNRQDLIDQYKIPIEEYIDRCENNIKLWDECISEETKKFISLWQDELPSLDHFDDYLSGLPHVQSQLYYPVVDGLGLLSKESAREQMSKYDLRSTSRKYYNDFSDKFNEIIKDSLTHSQFINLSVNS